jgi:membrane-associated phospholipid phosphatase
MRPQTAALAVSASLLLLASCRDSVQAPAVGGERSELAAASATKFWDANATANWTDIATSLAARRAVDVGRLYAYLSLAQLRAAEAAEAIRPHPPTSSAIGAASATVLAAFFAADVAEIEATLDAQAAADPWPGAKHQDFAAGEAIGRAVGAKVLAFAQGDRVGQANPGTPPIGPGYWVWTGGPIVRGNYLARPFYLASDDEFRPPPPPAFGSPDFNSALAQVRAISDTRTPEQLAIAQYWNVNQSGRSNAAMMNKAVELIRKYRVKEATAARIMFVTNSAIFDALVGCFNAKYHYWYIRPPQADPGITLPIGLPPHPSYPSAHSCVSGSATGVLGAMFPQEADALTAMAEEAGMSRVYGGIHYFFDSQAGLALGRAVAAKAVATDPSTVAVLP